MFFGLAEYSIFRYIKSGGINLFNLNISKIDKILMEEKLINISQKKEAQEYSKLNETTFEESLIQLGILEKKDFINLLKSRYGIESVDLKNIYPDMETVSSVDLETLQSAKSFPCTIEDGNIHMAMAEPMNIFHLDKLRKAASLNIVPLFSELKNIKDKQDEYFQKDILEREINMISENVSTKEGSDSERDGLSRLIKSVIYRAVIESASDIHFDPGRDKVNVRFRIDGILRKFVEIPNAIYPNLVSKMKLMSRLDIAEKRRPQDGSFEIDSAGKRLDIRSSFVPTLFGEKLVLRIVSKDTGLLDIDRLGLEKTDSEQIKRIIRQKQGLILITGPTGSGKSTMLYSIIKELNSKEKNIISIEEPVECKIEGVNQIQVNSEIGLGFGSILRHVLRQDPDIIVVGEIRDEETARMAVNASITGHLVISTVHTEDGPSTIYRLVDMGVEKHLAVSALKAVISQRLYRENCRECLEIKDIDENIRPFIDEIFNMDRIYESGGCEKCSNRGYTSRKPVVEILEMDSGLREIFGKINSISEIRKELKKREFRSLQDRMISLVKDSRMNCEDYFEYYSREEKLEG